MESGTAGALRTLMVANWKMHKTLSEAVDFVENLLGATIDRDVDVVICPPYTAIRTVAETLSQAGRLARVMSGGRTGIVGLEGADIRGAIAVGAQDVFWETKGAYTGEVSAEMLSDAGCSFCIVGHSERRQYFGETDGSVNRKVRALLQHGLNPIVCVGETLEQRERGETEKVLERQVKMALQGLESPEGLERLTVAYEPVWAIGTGRPATGADAARAAVLIREYFASMYGREAAEKVRVLYGGSVKPDNIEEFMREREINGALVGGASLDPVQFADICNFRKAV